MESGAKFDMVILWRIFAPSKGPKWAQQSEKLTTNNHTTKKKNKQKWKDFKIKGGFFWLVPLLKSRYRRQVPYEDIPEILGLRVGSKTAKMAKNGQKRPQEGENW